MKKQVSAAALASLLLATIGFAKDKPKSTLPPYVLSARTVCVIVDPSAGISIQDPQANEVAQKDVEAALISWGRFEPVMGTPAADLILVVRRGHGHLVDATISNPHQNNRAGMINPLENGVALGAQHGQQPRLSHGSGEGPPRPRAEVGGLEDSITVYQGGVDRSLDTAPTWRYVAKDGLRPHTVPAIAEFRKALAEAEMAAAKKP